MEQLDHDNSRRIDRLEKLLAEHIEVCTQQKTEIAEIAEFVHNVNASLKFANLIRNAVIWVGGLVAAVVAIYQSFKGQ